MMSVLVNLLYNAFNFHRAVLFASNQDSPEPFSYSFLDRKLLKRSFTAGNTVSMGNLLCDCVQSSFTNNLPVMRTMNRDTIENPTSEPDSFQQRTEKDLDSSRVFMMSPLFG